MTSPMTPGLLRMPHWEDPTAATRWIQRCWSGSALWNMGEHPTKTEVERESHLRHFRVWFALICFDLFWSVLICWLDRFLFDLADWKYWYLRLSICVQHHNSWPIAPHLCIKVIWWLSHHFEEYLYLCHWGSTSHCDLWRNLPVLVPIWPTLAILSPWSMAKLEQREIQRKVMNSGWPKNLWHPQTHSFQQILSPPITSLGRPSVDPIITSCHDQQREWPKLNPRAQLGQVDCFFARAGCIGPFDSSIHASLCAFLFGNVTFTFWESWGSEHILIHPMIIWDLQIYRCRCKLSVSIDQRFPQRDVALIAPWAHPLSARRRASVGHFLWAPPLATPVKIHWNPWHLPPVILHQTCAT